MTPNALYGAPGWPPTPTPRHGGRLKTITPRWPSSTGFGSRLRVMER